MKRNSRTPAHALEARRDGSRERFFNDKHELNANDKNDALYQIAKLLKMANDGELVTASEHEDVVMTASEKNADFRERYADRTSGRWARAGEMIAAEVYEVTRRDGFMRVLLAPQEITGTRPEVEVPGNNVTAVTMTTGGMVAPQVLTSDTFVLDEFYIQTHIKVEELEIKRSTGDIMDRRLNDSLEAILVGEDLAWKKMADATAGIVHAPITLTGNITPAQISFMRQAIIDQGLSPMNVLMSNTFVGDMTLSDSFQNLFDPVTKYNVLTTGQVMNAFGLNFFTDGFRKPNLRVLSKGDFYMVAMPEEHGIYTSRGPVESKEVDWSSNGSAQPARGWHVWEIMGMLITNPGSVIRLLRN